MEQFMITIYGKDACGFCTMAKNLCESKGVGYTYLNLGEDYEADEFTEKFPTARTFPQITVDDAPIGGFNELREHFAN
tara:strand:+ start:351 stop:584 length:234 start_codon:yes stop_codon:yes gene_type:complete